MLQENYARDEVEEEAELDFLRESLEEMDNLTDKTTQLLKVFDIRLKNLGRIIAPIYKSTQKLTRLYDNVEMTIESLDDILLFFNVAKDESETIRAGPDENELLPYLDSINRLKDASDALGHLELESASQSRKEIHELLRIGLDSLSQLFSQWLKQQSGGVDPAAYANASDIPTFPTDTAKLLSMLATYLNLVNDEVSNDLNLTKTYSGIRTRHLLKSLAQFHDMCSTYIKSHRFVSGSSRNGDGSGANVLGVQNGPYGGGSANGISPEMQFCTTHIEHWYEPGTSPFVQYTFNIVKLFGAERDLIWHIMPTVISQDTFLATAKRPFESYVSTGEKMASYFSDSTIQEILHILDVYGCLTENRSTFDTLLMLNSQKQASSGLDKLIMRIQAPLNISFTALINIIRNPFRDGMSPKQTGGIYDLVCNTLSFLTYMINYKNLLFPIFLSLGDGHWNKDVKQDPSTPTLQQQASDPNDGLSIFQHYLRDVVDSLSTMIDQAGKKMKRPGLQFVFLINNHSYVARVLRESMNSTSSETQKLGLGDLVGGSTLSRTESLIKRSRKGYEATWKSIMSSFPAASLSTAEKLNMFNQGFEDMLRTQKTYEIGHSDIQSLLISDAVQALIPTYESFLKQITDRSAPDIAAALKYKPKDLQNVLKNAIEE